MDLGCLNSSSAVCVTLCMSGCVTKHNIQCGPGRNGWVIDFWGPGPAGRCLCFTYVKLLFQKTQENQRGDSEAAPYSASSRKTSSRDSSVPAHAQLSPQVGRGWGPRLPRGRSGEETPAPAVPPPAHARGAQCFLTPQRRPAGAASSALAKTAGVFPPPRGRRNFGCQESNL